MFNAEEQLGCYEIPTVQETTIEDAEPERGCPDIIGRECMLRYLYARRKNQAIKCAHCGPVAAKVSHFYKAKKKKEERITSSFTNITRMKDPVALAHSALSHEKETKVSKKSVSRNKALVASTTKTEKIKAVKKPAPLKKETKSITPKRVRRTLAGIKKSVKEEMQLVRDGKKIPSRVQGVILILEEIISKPGVNKVGVRELTGLFNGLRGVKPIRSGVMGRTLRDYELRVVVEYCEKERKTLAYLLIDDLVQKFVSDGFVFHTQSLGRVKR